MKKLIPLLLLVAGLVAAGPEPAAADEKLWTCMAEAVESCDRDFGGDDERSIAIRGWCYMIRTSWCVILDPTEG